MASDCKDSPEISGTLIVMPENNAFAVQKAPETPKSNAIHARVCRSLMMSVVYVIFVYSILLQSAWTRKPVDPARWDTDLTGGAWKAGGAVFIGLIAIACSVLATELHSIAGNVIVYAFLATLFGLHLLTIDYASNRPELCRVKSVPDSQHSQLCGVSTHFRPRLWRNYLVLLSMSMEFIQYISLSVEHHSSPAVTAVLRASLLSLSDFDATFYICVAAVALYSLFVGVFVEINVQPSDALAPLLYDFAGGTLYLPLVSRMLSLIVTSPSQAKICALLIMLMFYSSTAVYVGVYRGDQGAAKSDINYVPRHCVIERTMAVLALFVAVFGSTNNSQHIACVVVLGVFAVVLSLSHCCSVTTVPHFRSLYIAIACWSLISNLITWSIAASASMMMVYIAVFLPGFGGLLIAWLLFTFITQRRSSAATQEDQPEIGKDATTLTDDSLSMSLTANPMLTAKPATTPQGPLSFRHVPGEFYTARKKSRFNFQPSSIRPGDGSVV